ncbi:MAG: hypothetical protein IMZ65_00755 [Planctomycetes bacterium]|nr:hypothetical protein [Planctomycetota bacterium]
MPEAPLSFKPQSADIVKSGTVVGLTDHVYDISDSQVAFGEVLVRGDLSGDLEYNGHTIRVLRVDTVTGLLVDDRGARGPVWQGVVCEVIR